MVASDKRWEIGKVMAGVVTAVALAFLATVSQLFMAYITYRAGEENQVAIAEVRETGNKTHEIVNSQRTAMEAKIENLLKEISDLKKTITEAKTRKAVGEERDEAREHPTEAPPPVPKNPNPEKAKE